MSLSTAWGFAWKKGAAGKKVSGKNPNLSFSCAFRAGKRGQNHLVLDEFRTQINPRLAPERGCRRKSLIYKGKNGVADGARTHDNRNHNPALDSMKSTTYSHFCFSHLKSDSSKNEPPKALRKNFRSLHAPGLEAQ